ncbi:MAG TPA: hypothetical protein VFH39_04195, partial [Candidatus Saccharimonadales bacterium]|nr:hypothetical protein [Candidatus Saccharimonadales bacterium]
MAGFDSIIGITIKAIDGASGVVSAAAKNIEATQESVASTSAVSAARIGSAMDTAGEKMTALGSAMTRGVTLPLAAVAGASAKMAYDFQNQMELIRTSAGIPQDQIAGLSDKILALAGQVGQAPEKLAQGFYHIASAGNGIWNTAQMMDILKVAAQGANLGLADMDTTTYALSSTMASGISGVKDASDAMAVLNAIVGAGD